MQRFEQRKSAKACDDANVQTVAQATGLQPIVARILCERGIDTPEDAIRFLHPDETQLHDPYLLPDMQASVARIRAALDEGEKIAVFCDYDADGTCGGCALYLHLKASGADVSIMTPNRHKEGYGLSVHAVDELDSADVTLIITVDCGITNVDEVAYAKQKGIDVIITDHHECGPQLPDTDYIVNPKRPDSTYPCALIAGCGVAFKLIHALSSLDEAMAYIDLVAIGTITDIVPLLDENRAIAHLGIQKMRQNPSAGIAALADAAGIRLASISSYGISFGLGPRINAAGRMDTAHTAIDILRARQRSDVLEDRAKALCELNDLRKKDVADISADAEKMIRDFGYMRDSAILLADERWNTGVIGIAAAKISGKYTRPCVLFGGNDGDLVGSARSVAGINMHEVLSQFEDRYEKFGGHAQAAGLTIKPDVLGDLRRDVCAYINAHYDESVFAERLTYDMALDVADVSHKLVGDFEKLEPVGHGNEKPMVAVKNADITETKYIGKNTQPHLKFTMRQNRSGVSAISFFFKEKHSICSRTCDFLCEAGINDFNDTPQLVVRKIAMHYDTRLVDSFIYANRRHMTQRLMDEVVYLAAHGKDVISEAELETAIADALAVSRFGLAIVVNTVPAFERLRKLSTVDKAMNDGSLALLDARSCSVDNCIACGSAPMHDRILHIGISGGAMADEVLVKAYREYAAEYYSDRQALLEVYQTIRRCTAAREKAPHEIAKEAGISTGKTAFALRVFDELELIARGKSGRILALKNTGDKKELQVSECYRSFEHIISAK